MSNKYKIIGVIAAALTAMSANATVYVATYTGTGTVSDTAGIFGTAHADYRLVGYQAKFRFDDALGFIYDSGSAVRLSGYASKAGPSAVTATISIDGSRAYDFLGTGYGYAQQRLTTNGASTSHPEVEHVVQSQSNPDPTIGRADQIYAYVGDDTGTDNFLTSRDFRAPLSHTTASGDYTNAGFNIYGAGGHAAGAEAVGYFGVSSVSIRAAAVPETGSLSLMVAGLALTGVGLRRRMIAAT